MNSEITHIPIADINTDFQKFKISRNILNENLLYSIKKHGVLNPVYLLKINEGYSVIFGFNRIESAKISGLKTIPAYIDTEIDNNFFLNQYIIKIFNKEIGPSGKIKLIKILYEELNFSKDKVEDLCNDFLIPIYFSKIEFYEKYHSLPVQLLEYLDNRDVPFKIIDKLVKLEKQTVDILSFWTYKTSMKLNIFRSIIDMLFDMQKSGKNIFNLNEIFPENLDDRNVAENLIHDRIYNLRYPLYSVMLKNSEKIVNSMAADKIFAEIPRYFDGGIFYIKIPVDKKSGYSGLKQRLELIKQNDIDEILKLM